MGSAGQASMGLFEYCCRVRGFSFMFQRPNGATILHCVASERYSSKIFSHTAEKSKSLDFTI